MDAREFPPPNIPKTPSRTINSMLETRCNRTFENRFKAAPAYVVCGVFQAITQVYTLIMTKTNKEDASHRIWCISCGVVSLMIALGCFLVYKLIMGCSFLLHTLVLYSFIFLALGGIGLGVSGIVFFDKKDQDAARIDAAGKKLLSGASSVYESRRGDHQD